MNMKSWFSPRRILIFVIAAAVFAALLLMYAFHHPQGGTPVSPATNIKCLESPEYFVIDNNPGLPGLDVIAKHKTGANKAVPCVSASVASSDVAIRNDLPEFVIGLAGRFLIVDSGTAPPPRGLIVYDLDAQTSIYTDSYSSPISIATGTVTYWATTKQAVTAANCPDLGQYKADGLGAVIESHVVLDLSTLTKQEMGEYRCEPTQ